jgi:FG-GAP-like repeat/PKD domain
MRNKVEKTHYVFRLIVCCIAICFSVFVSETFADTTIDNGGSGTSSTGVWSTSGGSSPYGTNSLWSRDGATYTWSFNSQPAGTYRVHMWWSAWPSRASSINVSINHIGGPTPVEIDQSVNAGQWYSLPGEYLFGSSGSVTITAADGSKVSTCADAVWFEFISGNTAPTAYIDSITPNPADPGQTVAFSGHGTDDESITGYSWESDIDDAFFSDQDSFSTSSLVEGVHTISFKVKDDEDVWSDPVTEVLTVGTPPVEVIIDNDDPGTSYSGGYWGYSSGADPYGGSSRTERKAGAIYTFQGSITGYQEVSLWWTYWSSRCSEALADIYDGTTLLASVEMNHHQQDLAGQWNVLGSYTFSGTARVVLRAQSDCSTSADAVRFRLISGNTPPTAHIDLITPNPVEPGQTVAFSGHGTDNGDISGYSWESDIEDEPLSNQNSFSMSSLSEGVHTISFKVKDDEDVWSEPVTEVLTVGTPPVEVIIDNDDPGTSYSGGTWGYSSGADPYGDSSRAKSLSGATYTFQGSVTGYQKVSLWWTYWSSRCTEVPVDIYDGATFLETVKVNQQDEGEASEWNVLGTYLFSGTARVVIRSQGGCSVNADAVKFVTSIPVELRRVRIQGPPAVIENTSYDYELRADYTDGTNRMVEADSWSVDCTAYADISTTGLFTSTNDVTADELCRITANYTDGGVLETDTNDVYIKNVVHGNVLRHKFTVDLSGQGQIQPVMGDIDGDGVQEIVMAVGSDNIVAINGKTGAIEWSVPGSQYAVELADLNKDGIPEILLGIERRGSTGPRVRALRGDGSTLWTSPQLHGDFLTAFPIASADIDGDGYPEIYLATEDTDPDPYSGNIDDYEGAIFKLDHNGNVLAESWLWHPCWGGMAIGDYNNDGVFEVYVNDRRVGYHGMTESKGIQALNAHTLEFIWGRPDIQHSSPHPVLADVLGDSNLEVIATEITLKGPHVLDPETGYSILDYSDERLPTHGAPTVYDIDNDGHLEYIVSTSYPSSAPYKFVVFDLISGTVDFEAYFPYRLTWSPSVGDVTGDGFMEILAATGDQLEVVGDNHNGSYPLVVYDRNFNMLDWVDMPNGTGQLTTARVYDTDGDGYNEVVVAGFYGKLMVYDTDARTPNPAPRSWVQLYSEYRRGAAEYVPAPGK